jgi:thiopeptide-type bacteriocin biosynthesis protein
VNTQDCLYVIAYLPRERIEGLLLDEFAPLAREIQHHPSFESLFFVRFSEPRWQLRFRVFGRPDWIRGELRGRLTSRLAELERVHAIEGHELTRYDREHERYGGEEGMALAERLFFLDSMAAIELCDAERRGGLARSRREIALLLTDRLIDLAGVDRSQRLALYQHGYAWALETDWSEADVSVLERRFQELLPGLDRLFSESCTDEERWGNEATAAMARHFLEAARPVLRAIAEGHRAGRIRQQLPYLVWSYAHMFTNRMGIEPTAEAILRFFMHRYLQERRHVAA